MLFRSAVFEKPSRVAVLARYAREDRALGIFFRSVGIDVILAEGGAGEEGREVEDVVARPRLGGEGEFELERSDNGAEEFLQRVIGP